VYTKTPHLRRLDIAAKASAMCIFERVEVDASIREQERNAIRIEVNVQLNTGAGG
jgi:hypothetical protein